MAADKVGGKVLICFGGNSRSQGYGRMAVSDQKRRAFLVLLDEMMKEYEFVSDSVFSPDRFLLSSSC